MTTIKIVEREYPILGSKREVSKTAEQILYAKDNRKNLSPDEETVLFKSTVQTAHKKYDVFPLSLEDKDISSTIPTIWKSWSRRPRGSISTMICMMSLP
jgi:ABC-type molybdate transport system ATPase subunit